MAHELCEIEDWSNRRGLIDSPVDTNVRVLCGLGDPMCDTTLRTRLCLIRPYFEPLRRFFRVALVHAQRRGDLRASRSEEAVIWLEPVHDFQSFSSS